jgi:hypothetical protein
MTVHTFQHAISYAPQYVLHTYVVFLPSQLLDDQLEITNGFLDLNFIGQSITMMYGNVFITFLYYCLMLYFFVGPLIFLHKRAVL